MPKTHLTIVFDDFDDKNQSKNLVKFIECVGVERVFKLGVKYGNLNVVAKSDEMRKHPKLSYQPSGDYHILTGMSVERKAEAIKEIERLLKLKHGINLPMRVCINDMEIL